MNSYKITKPIRLIELFAGIGSQAMALKSIGANFEYWKVVEFDKYAIKSYNAIHGTNFSATDITQIHGKDLEIVDTDRYEYVLTYSFPCQSLSLAGRMGGMEEGSGTTSSLLWEVRRLLNECETLPQVLIMENVTQVHSKKNLPHFEKWLDFLKSKGYNTCYADMNAKDYGVAQSRNRTIAVSILGEGTFTFPKAYPLNKVMVDYLEDEVDEKYYIIKDKAKDLIDKLVASGKIPSHQHTDNQSIKVGNVGDIKTQGRSVYLSSGVSPTLIAGMSHGNTVPYIVEGSKVIGQMDNTVDHTFESANRVYDTEASAPTLPTCCGGGHQPKILEVKVIGGMGEKKSNSGTQYYQQDRIYDTEQISPALNSSGEQLVPKIVDCVAMRGRGENWKQQLEVREDNITNTITTVQKDNMVLEQSIVDNPYSSYKEWVWEIDGQRYLIRIRKLTPRECWRLMDFSDEDFEKAQAVNSSTQLYKQAGNSIVKNVLCEVFKELINE